jgi:hypothetical protein
MRWTVCRSAIEPVSPAGMAPIDLSVPTNVRRMFRSRRQQAVLVALIVTGLSVGGSAAAYWSGAGSGRAVGSTGTAAAVVLSAATPDAVLAPGGQADVVLTVSNPNSFAVFVSSLALEPGQGNGGFTVGPAHAACDVSTLSFIRQTNMGAGWNIPAKNGDTDGSQLITLLDAISMSLDAEDTCQGAVFSVYLVAGA